MVVLSGRHAQQAVDTQRIATGTGKRAVLARMSTGDHIVVYSPRTDHPGGAPLGAVTVVGTITGEQPEGDEASGFGLAAELRRVDPVPLERLRDHLPVPLLRFGSLALSEAQGLAVWGVVAGDRPEYAMANASPAALGPGQQPEPSPDPAPLTSTGPAQPSSVSVNAATHPADAGVVR